MITAIIYASLAIIATCYLSEWLLSLSDGPNAPPRARARIPLIGHGLGIFKRGNYYYTKLGAQQSSKIYTVGVLNFKIYVINSRRLIPLVQRLSKTISFTPFMQFAAKAFVDVSKFTFDLHADGDFTRDLSRVMKDSLAPGRHLDYQNLRATESLKDLLEQLISQSEKSGVVEVKLHEWVKHVITVAASDGVYGSANPFKDERVEKAFWYVFL